MARIKRDKRTEKRHRRAADAPRRSSRRKHKQKKSECKLRIVRFLCVICSNTVSKKRYTLLCNHSFHLKCIKKWLTEDPQRTCPICRRFVSPNTELYQLPSPAVQRTLVLSLLRTRGRIFGGRSHPPDRTPPIQGQVNPRDSATSSSHQSSYLDNSSTLSVNPSSNFSDSRTDLPASSPPNLDNRNVNLDDQSSHLGNSSTHSVDPAFVFQQRIRCVCIPIRLLNRHLDDQSSHLDNSSTHSVDPSSNFSDLRANLPASSPNLDSRNVNLDQYSYSDNSCALSVDSSSNFSDSRTDLSASSPPDLDNRNVNSDDQSSHLGHSRAHSVDPASVIRQRIRCFCIPIWLGNRPLDDQSSHLDNSNTHSVDPLSNFSDLRTNLPASSPNLDSRNVNLDQSSHSDNSSTHSVDPSSNASDSRTNSPHPSPHLDNGNTDIEDISSHLDNSRIHSPDSSSNVIDLRTDSPDASSDSDSPER